MYYYFLKRSCCRHAANGGTESGTDGGIFVVTGVVAGIGAESCGYTTGSGCGTGSCCCHAKSDCGIGSCCDRTGSDCSTGDERGTASGCGTGPYSRRR